MTNRLLCHNSAIRSRRSCSTDKVKAKGKKCDLVHIRIPCCSECTYNACPTLHKSQPTSLPGTESRIHEHEYEINNAFRGGTRNSWFCNTASAVTYPLPTDGSRLIGQNQVITIPEGNTQPLEYFAAEYQMGLSNMLEANPGVDTFLPKGGTVLNIPQQLILPDTVHEGIVINSAEMRLYYYPKGTNTVIVLPIGIGQLGKDTPINWTTKVERKKAGPTWTPTAKMHAEYRAAGEPLPAVVPAGPDNPMGLYALYIGRLYAIHGTNANFGVGLRVSHGCVRLRNDDIKFLFENVPVGTRVQFIDEPVKATTEPDGSRYIEVHNPLSTTEAQFEGGEIVPITLNKSITSITGQSDVDQAVVEQAVQNRSGMPVRLN